MHNRLQELLDKQRLTESEAKELEETYKLVCKKRAQYLQQKTVKRLFS